MSTLSMNSAFVRDEEFCVFERCVILFYDLSVLLGKFIIQLEIKTIYFYIRNVWTIGIIFILRIHFDRHRFNQPLS